LEPASAVQQLVNDLDLLVWSKPSETAQTVLLHGNGNGNGAAPGARSADDVIDAEFTESK
jgi:hypothetical protein